MCFERMHNFTESEIKEHHVSIISTSHYVLVSPQCASEYTEFVSHFSTPLTSSVVILSVIWGGCYALKVVTPSETRSAAIAVSIPICAARCRSASHQCTSRTISGSCLLCYQLVTGSGQAQLIKSFFSSIRLRDVICVQLVYQNRTSCSASSYID